MLHDLSELALHPPKGAIQALVFGHSHKPKVEQRAGVLHVNPGSAGPRRFRLPIAAGELLVDRRSVSARIVEF
jgi:predicted phosphodiesterase